MSGLSRIVRLLANIAAAVLVVWILLFLFDANRANTVVQWFHDAADWLATWSRNLFAIDNAKLRTTVNYGIAAVVYAAVGVLLARVVSRRG
ncbi:hypothetical protein [Streptacidiphilus sp. ASG 303]|uniref:hypothetical protein n=1 Tax=Streptomycetaceae TaxID=2062 RepID=UPI001E372E82|nr:hypothetical protein [Streptacidiphilus sp. ASG 303]MCD0482525.1 hypothetical protein [Streptacidiphilus sp. ASG 303]